MDGVQKLPRFDNIRPAILLLLQYQHLNSTGMMKQKYAVIALGIALLAGCNPTKKKSGAEEIVGNDRDSHGCIPSAGYTWSEVRNDCIRLFETGIRLEGTGSADECAFVVFSPDSLKAELFFSNDAKPEVLDRRSLPNGRYAWNVEDDDTKNITQQDGLWTVSQRGIVLYSQQAGSGK